MEGLEVFLLTRRAAPLWALSADRRRRWRDCSRLSGAPGSRLALAPLIASEPAAAVCTQSNTVASRPALSLNRCEAVHMSRRSDSERRRFRQEGDGAGWEGKGAEVVDGTAAPAPRGGGAYQKRR